ncbi:MAG: hemin uptake protein HemP [Zoogloea sp.]|nr:hemin uptake protein HemP [Zoogloea sp.]
MAPVPGVDLRATISSASLLKGQPSVLIEHQGVIYALRATRAGKLILTK